MPSPNSFGDCTANLPVRGRWKPCIRPRAEIQETADRGPSAPISSPLEKQFHHDSCDPPHLPSRL